MNMDHKTIPLIILGSILLSGCGPVELFGPTLTSTPTNTQVPTGTFTPTLTPTKTFTPSKTPSIIPEPKLLIGKWSIYINWGLLLSDPPEDKIQFFENGTLLFSNNISTSEKGVWQILPTANWPINFTFTSAQGFIEYFVGDFYNINKIVGKMTNNVGGMGDWYAKRQ
jgi:hypothetical protein